ncbi:MAG: accessory gene regulator B family protein [Lutispora sp.]|nr:accessory gene regulator B family protein [Lutispora sp.]
MSFSIAEKITEKLEASQIINSEDKELYTYGLVQGFSIIISIAITAIIGTIFRMIVDVIFFTIAFIPLRLYAGGYHAKTQVRCYVFSIVMITAVLLGIRLIPWNDYICFIVALGAGSIIVSLAPVEDSNKPLDQKEKAVYKRRTYVVLGILTALILAFWFMGLHQTSVCIIMALTVLAFMLVLGKIKIL